MSVIRLMNLLNVFCPDSGLSILSSLVKLQYLNLASCSKLTDSCLQHVTGWAFLALTHQAQAVINTLRNANFTSSYSYVQECPKLL